MLTRKQEDVGSLKKQKQMQIQINALYMSMQGIYPFCSDLLNGVVHTRTYINSSLQGNYPLAHIINCAI